VVGNYNTIAVQLNIWSTNQYAMRQLEADTTDTLTHTHTHTLTAVRHETELAGFSIDSEDIVFTSGNLCAVPTKFHPYQFGPYTKKYNISYEITVKNSTNSGPTALIYICIYTSFAKYIFDYLY
jgi:hypothetical protein